MLNGPLRVSSLETVVSSAGHWDRRIRSIRLGDAATVTVYAEPNLIGRSARYLAGATVSQIDTGLTGRIRSLQLECVPR